MEKYGKDAEVLKALQDEVVGLRRAIHDAIQQTMWDVLRVRERVVE